MYQQIRYEVEDGALDLLLSARTVTAHEAEQMGFVNRVVPHAELARVTRAYAMDMAVNCAPHSLSAIKRDVLQHLHATLHQAERENMEHMLESFARPDFRESLSSMAEKRAPKFQRVGASHGKATP